MRVDALKLSDFRGKLLQFSNLHEAERILDTNYEKIAQIPYDKLSEQIKEIPMHMHIIKIVTKLSPICNPNFIRTASSHGIIQQPTPFTMPDERIYNKKYQKSRY